MRREERKIKQDAKQRKTETEIRNKRRGQRYPPAPVVLRLRVARFAGGSEADVVASCLRFNEAFDIAGVLLVVPVPPVRGEEDVAPEVGVAVAADVLTGMVLCCFVGELCTEVGAF